MIAIPLPKEKDADPQRKKEFDFEVNLPQRAKTKLNGFAALHSFAKKFCIPLR